MVMKHEKKALNCFPGRKGEKENTKNIAGSKIHALSLGCPKENKYAAELRELDREAKKVKSVPLIDGTFPDLHLWVTKECDLA